MRQTLLLALATVGPLAAATPHAAAQRPPSAEKPETEQLKTKDGVELAITYYRSSAGRDAAPVVMIHDYNQGRAGYNRLALRLQKPEKDDKHESFAVVTVDLRGHGDSKQQRVQGRTRTLEAAKLKKPDMQAMVLSDMEAVRKFLVSENDAGRLNLNRLSVVGTGLGASVAMNWTAVDWTVPQLATVKQGKDIKAAVLVSPRWSNKGLSMKNPLRVPGMREKLAVLILYGSKDRRVTSDAKRIYKQLERYHKDEITPSGGKLPPLAEFGPETDLQGSDWLKQSGKKGEDLILRFLTRYAVEPEFEYLKRRQD